MAAEGTAAPPGADPHDPADPLVGMLVADKYRITARVAKGGMGRIYLAEQIPLGRPVALKVLEERGSDGSREFEQRFFLEASTCARLSHPNTVTIFDYGRLDLPEGHTWYMVMEFIQGLTLRAVLRREGHFSPQRALRVCREIARSLREAHRLGVVHRDLKPTNVMLVPTDEGEAVKVLDFGIVKLLDSTEDDAELTRGGRLVGTPRYMAPEMVRRRAGGIDGRTDLYSLGMVLYELLGGKVPFTGDTMDVALKQLQEPVPPIFDLTGVEVPPDVEAIARCCLEKRAEDRYADVSVFIEAVDAALSQLGQEPDRPQGIISRPTLDGRGDSTLSGTLGRGRGARVVSAEATAPTPRPGGPVRGAGRGGHTEPGLLSEPGSLPDSGSLPEPPSPGQHPAGGRLGAAALLVLVACLGALGGWWWMNRGPAGPATPLVVQSTGSTPAAPSSGERGSAPLLADQPNTVPANQVDGVHAAPGSDGALGATPASAGLAVAAPGAAVGTEVGAAGIGGTDPAGLGGAAQPASGAALAPGGDPVPVPGPGGVPAIGTVAPAADPAVALPRRVYVESTPTEAAVFDGKAFLGNTPLEVSVGAAARRLTLKRSGFEAARVVLDQRSPDTVTHKLRRVPERVAPPPGSDLDIRTTR